MAYNKIKKSELEGLMLTGEKIKIDGFAETKFITIDNTEHNQDILEKGKKLNTLLVTPYNEKGEILGIDHELRLFACISHK